MGHAQAHVILWKKISKLWVFFLRIAVAEHEHIWFSEILSNVKPNTPWTFGHVYHAAATLASLCFPAARTHRSRPPPRPPPSLAPFPSSSWKSSISYLYREAGAPRTWWSVVLEAEGRRRMPPCRWGRRKIRAPYRRPLKEPPSAHQVLDVMPPRHPRHPVLYPPNQWRRRLVYSKGEPYSNPARVSHGGRASAPASLLFCSLLCSSCWKSPGSTASRPSLPGAIDGSWNRIV